MFVVIYKFTVNSGAEMDFKNAWKALTELIYKYEGSLGSRLHRQSDLEYIAYAQWPSRERWEQAGDKLPPEADKFRKIMRNACTEIETLFELERDIDLLKTDLYQ